MSIKQMQGVSAHLEYLKIKDEPRRRQCLYIENKICNCNESPVYLSKCAGRSHCSEYKPVEKNNKSNVNKNRDEAISELRKLIGRRYILLNLNDNVKIIVDFVEEAEVDISNNKLSMFSSLASAVKSENFGSNIQVIEDGIQVQYKILKFVRLK